MKCVSGFTMVKTNVCVYTNQKFMYILTDTDKKGCTVLYLSLVLLLVSAVDLQQFLVSLQQLCEGGE